ncbi:UNVERIFIED_CONTAM: hypothetical protein FKN15_051863, partial [Acipenser sinensis]
GDFTWNSMSGRSVRLKPVPIQSLSELERVRLQEVAFNRLLQEYDLGCQITIPRDGQKRKKSLRRKLDSLAKEKKDKEFVPQAFGMPLSQVITNDRTHKQKQDSQKEEQKESPDLVTSILQFGLKRQNKELSSSNSSLSSTSETPNESTSPNTPEAAPRTRRRGGMSVDSITDLDDNQSRLLEALQLSLPAEAQSKKEKQRDKKLSLNPIYRQVPRLVDSCCQYLEKYGLQTVGIFRVGSSKKRVRQLRAEFDSGVDVLLDEEQSVHDIAALLKEFLRDIPDPLLTRELYTAFINTVLMELDEQQNALQLLIYLLPPCNCDTLHRLLNFLSTVASHAEDSYDKDGQEGGMSVDSITDLDDNQSRLLEALQLSLPAEAQSKKEKQRDKKLSLNPIYRQVPRLVDSCCQYLEKYGLQTVGIFRVGSSKKRVRQLRAEFDSGVDVLLDEEQSVHDIAALLKEFLRDIPDPLLTRELYTAFINTVLMELDEQQNALQLLIYLLPPCNCDTLHRLLNFLSTVASHAEDSYDKDGQEITGNKMTSLNLATIFGPNLLHKQKSTDKEFSVQSSARAEESTAIIGVVQRLIQTYEALFMVGDGFL